MNASHALGGSAIFLAAVLACRAVVADSPAAADPELLEFLGELAGEDAAFIQYTTSSHAKRALKQSGIDAAPVPAATVDALAWATLEAPVQELLAPHADRWATLSPERQHALADGARRWLTLDGIGRAQANDRWQAWRALTPGQRKRVHKAWIRFRGLAPEQQQAVRIAFLHYQELPAEGRDWISDRWLGMTPDERERAIQRRQSPGPQPGAVDKRPCPTC